MKTCTVSLYCPPMAIYRDPRGGILAHRTAAEPMTATIVMPDGSVLTIGGVLIPATEVDLVSIVELLWRVRACVGTNESARRPSEPPFTVKLPPEDTRFEMAALTMVALAIDAPTVMVDGRDLWEGSVRFPDCRVDLLKNPMVAEAVTAVGSLTLRE